jgi:hypothetical protein
MRPTHDDMIMMLASTGKKPPCPHRGKGVFFTETV